MVMRTRYDSNTFDNSFLRNFLSWRFSTQLEVQTYRSASNMNNFRVLPFKIYRTHLFNILNTFYKDAAMENFKNCSNLPQFKHLFEPPLKKDIYYMDKCIFDESGFPNYISEGFYKVMVRGFGPVEWTMVLISQIEAVY